MPGPTSETTRRLVPFEEADEAIAASRAGLPGPPILLLPPAGSAGYLGLGWFHALKERLENGADIAIDCDADAALAHEALRQGFAHVIFTGEDIFSAELKVFAESRGGVLYRRRP